MSEAEVIDTTEERVRQALTSCKCGSCRRELAAKAAPEWCRPLLDLVDYERANGKAATLRRYHPLCFELLAPLNHDVPSVHGVVDVDWMFRVALFSADLAGAYATYVVGKTLWNTTRGVMSKIHGDGQYKLEYASMLDPANRNAPAVAHRWLKPGATLATLFAPGVEAARFALRR